MSPWQESDESRLGKALHRCAELWVKSHPMMPDVVMVAREFDCEDQLPRMIRVWRHMLAWLETHLSDPTTPSFAEQKIVVDLKQRSAAVPMEEGVRNYGDLGPMQFGMTLDLFLPLGLPSYGDTPVVLDWKTGHMADGYWPQIGLNVLGLSWLYDMKVVRGGILHATEDGVSMKLRSFLPAEIAAIGEDTAEMLAEVPHSVPQPGSHCTEMRCGAFGECPETALVLTQLAQIEPANGNAAISLDINDPEQAAYVLHRMRAYDAFAKQIRGAVAHFVGDKEWTVKDGLLKATFRNVTRTSVPDLIALARAKGATDEEIEACSHSHRESAGIRVVKG